MCTFVRTYSYMYIVYIQGMGGQSEHVCVYIQSDVLNVLLHPFSIQRIHVHTLSLPQQHTHTVIHTCSTIHPYVCSDCDPAGKYLHVCIYTLYTLRTSDPHKAEVQCTYMYMYVRNTVGLYTCTCTCICICTLEFLHCARA